MTPYTPQRLRLQGGSIPGETPTAETSLRLKKQYSSTFTEPRACTLDCVQITYANLVRWFFNARMQRIDAVGGPSPASRTDKQEREGRACDAIMRFAGAYCVMDPAGDV